MTVTELRERLEKLEADGLGDVRVINGHPCPYSPVGRIWFDAEFDTVEVS